MASLNTNKVVGTSKPTYNVFINEFGCALNCVIPKSISMYPLSGVVNGYNDTLVISILSYGFDRSHKI